MGYEAAKTKSLAPILGWERNPALAGLAAGSFQAMLFSPYDRALYLSVVNNRPFLSFANWRSPFQGYGQAFLQRTLSGGLYFPLEDISRQLFGMVNMSQTGREMLAGYCAGAMNGLILNPLSAIKYKMWSSDSASYWVTARKIYTQNGVGAFFLGVRPTLVRDIAFGFVYTPLRHTLRRRFHKRSVPTAFHDVFAAVCATVVSSPFNYVRNVHFSSKDANVPKMLDTLRSFITSAMDKPTKMERVFYAQRLLGIGWGTLRVSLGIAFSAFVYESLTGTRKQHRESQKTSGASK
uniref:ADP,ATP carrier protein n=1 Tax=Rhodosorus marinus TaxID=101924 RepID=A0A7S2ZV66_9RHOD|mmetsp:Transcript_33578/g.132485  ORF Transcript_33578/g.132485 Transcript_33578/m.132485 type:complete len:293 (+) Transcript_33578:350-1228(+)